jgi:predicted dehydrogenase
MTTRRHFLQQAGLLVLANRLPHIAASDQITVGLIGCNNMGFSDLQSFLRNPEVRCVALCDVDHQVLTRRTADLEKMGVAKPQHYTDYRRMLERKDLDVVIIGSPDHWHCLQLVEAIQAGKDVYVEKPIGNSIAEINVMQRVVAQSDRMVQVGQWQRSQPHLVSAINYVHSGQLGRIRAVKSWIYVDWKGSLPVLPDGPVPDGVNYDLWLGPAPKRPFNPNRFHGSFRWYWDYAGGLMTDWGVHLIDYALYGMKASTPRSVMAIGGKYAFPNDAMQTPDTMYASYDFGDFVLQWEQTIGIGNGPYGSRNHGIAFIGENGTLVMNREGWEVIPEKKKIAQVPLQAAAGSGLDAHVTNFLSVVKSRQRQHLNADIEVGRNVALVAQMGNIAYRVGQKIHWNDAQQKFAEKEANRYLMPHYHNGWKMPQ